MPQFYRRNLLYTHRLGRIEPPLPSHNAPFARQDRVIEPKLLDTGRDLPDLRLIVRPGVLIVRLQATHRQIPNLQSIGIQSHSTPVAGNGS